MRLFISWIVGILLFFLMNLLEDYLSTLFGFTTFIEYGETVFFSNRYYEEESDGYFTGLGYFFMYLEFLVAIRGGMAVFHGEINAGVSKKDNLTLLLIGGGLLTWAISSEFLYLFLNSDSSVLSILKTLIGLYIFYVCYKIYNKKIINFKDK
tara:strand:+ start:384 stop:839 length:456 start_codon:yes stop_codon:yes gene_type:complete